MRSRRRIALHYLPAFAIAAIGCSITAAQDPIVIAPIVVDTAVPLVVKAVKPKTTNGLAKFEGFVMHANIAEITVRAKDRELSIRSFSLSRAASEKMQKIVDKGGYQFGDKVTVFYDPANLKAVKIKGKASRPI